MLVSKGFGKQGQTHEQLAKEELAGLGFSTSTTRFVLAARSNMTKTRRQSKQAAAAATETATRETSPLPPQSQAQWTVAIPEDLDFDLLSDLLPETQLDSPTPESIISLYRLVIAQASAVDANQKELEETKAEVQKKEVELDQALQDREAASKEVESVSDELQNQVKQLQREKEEIGMSCLLYVCLVLSVSQSRRGTTYKHSSLPFPTHHLLPTMR